MILWIIVGIIALSLIFCGFMCYLEEKNRCKHSWEEGDRTRWRNGFGGEYLKVELKCRKCGEIEWRQT